MCLNVSEEPMFTPETSSTQISLYHGLHALPWQQKELHLLSFYFINHVFETLLVLTLTGSPPSKVYGNIRAVASRAAERFWRHAGFSLYLLPAVVSLWISDLFCIIGLCSVYWKRFDINKDRKQDMQITVNKKTKWTQTMMFNTFLSCIFQCTWGMFKNKCFTFQIF